MSAVRRVLPNSRACTAIQQLWSKEIGQKTTGRACSSWLIAQGHTLEVPRLDRVALHHSSFGSDAAEARFASVLLDLGIAKAADWKPCGGDPTKFLERTLDRFAQDHGEAEMDGAFDVSITLSTAAHEWCETEDEPDGSQMFLYMEAASCGFVNLGPALALCEREHARLPATFARLFLNSIGRVFRIYDDRDADEHLSILEDNYDPSEDAEALRTLPDRNKILPPCMKQEPLSRKRTKAMVSGMARNSRVGSLLRATLELAQIAETVKLPEIPEPIRELFCDCNPPVPVLLAIYQPGDAIEACFDDERQYMLEQTPEPWPLIPFDGTDRKCTREAFDCLAGVLETLAAARRVLDGIPGWKPVCEDEESRS